MSLIVQPAGRVAPITGGGEFFVVRSVKPRDYKVFEIHGQLFA